MTTRDPRSRDLLPRGDAGGPVREPTQSMSLDAGEDPALEHPSLALGTHGKDGKDAPLGALGPPDGNTRVASPGARGKTLATVPPRSGAPPGSHGAPPSSQSPDEPEHIGSVLGSYRVVELLGRGGMGFVYRAEHVKLGREVALKLLRSDYARRRDAVARFFQEARTVNRVRHRNIVDVTDFVELDDGTTFIIMEMLHGQSLGLWARTGVDLPRALAVLVQICDGLAAAHEVGVIHRDLKPDNVIVVPTPDGAELVKLLDFGVAKLLNRDDEDVGFQTAAGSVIGTPAYMSPEQAGGMAVDARSDIYSLGAIMYELFCGQPMFRGRSFGEYVRKHLTEMPVPPTATPAGQQMDPRLEALIMRCLEKDPIQRFPNIGALRDALFSMLGGMETMLPGLASLTVSGVRPLAGANVNVGASVNLAPMPQLPAAPIPTYPTPGVPAAGFASQPGHPSAGYLPQPAYASAAHLSHGGQPGSPFSTGVLPPAPTPAWVWFVGGAVAVGLGVGAAVWYAGRGDLPPAAPTTAAAAAVTQPAPIAEPPAPTPDPPAGATAARPVEVRFQSMPEADVFAEGGAAALCRTPCTYAIDPKDGGAPDQRRYVVRAEGYQDAAVVVDLKGAQREFQLALEPIATLPATLPATATLPAPAAPEEPTPDDATARAGDPAPRPSARPTAKRPAVKRPGRPAAEEPRPAPEPVKAPPPEEPKPPPEEPAKPPTKKKPPGSIDSTETLDPFRRKS